MNRQRMDKTCGLPEGTSWSRSPNDHEDGNTPLLDDDPALDFLLYEQMRKENKPQSQTGCLGVVILCCVIPAGWLAHHWL